jgi:16S rRNA A1518/A1519 N6-dimethyltransferase RsmA/KsgA/DIM1 with predicted DNA glycosylase/AP lyase activity
MNFFERIKEAFRPEVKVNSEIVERERRNMIEDKSYFNSVVDYVKLSRKTLEEERKQNCFLKNPRASERKKHKKVMARVLKKQDISSSLKELEAELKLQLFCRGCGMGTEFEVYEKGKYLVGEAVPIVRGFFFNMQ